MFYPRTRQRGVSHGPKPRPPTRQRLNTLIVVGDFRVPAPVYRRQRHVPGPSAFSPGHDPRRAWGMPPAWLTPSERRNAGGIRDFVADLYG